MKTLSEFRHSVDYLLTDIDDTLTDDGKLGPEAYQALWNLNSQGLKVIPVTGRPAGWCEMIARMWPIHGVIGENGGFYFRYHLRKMLRVYALEETQRKSNRKQLESIETEILKQVPGSALASDQFCRQMDLAIDFCEDVEPLQKSSVQKIVALFQAHGAQAKVSSIHVNGWFGAYDKLTMSLRFLSEQFSISPSEAKAKCAFAGDSPNDEPMFEFFPHSFAVANIQKFIPEIKNHPTYVSPSKGGLGFTEISQVLITSRSTTSFSSP